MESFQFDLRLVVKKREKFKTNIKKEKTYVIITWSISILEMISTYIAQHQHTQGLGQGISENALSPLDLHLCNTASLITYVG